MVLHLLAIKNENLGSCIKSLRSAMQIILTPTIMRSLRMTLAILPNLSFPAKSNRYLKLVKAMLSFSGSWRPI